MPDLLLSGPAGGGKSQLAAALRAQATEPTVIIDFTAIYVALTGDVRQPDGTFPLRDPLLLPTVEYVRRAALTAARTRELQVIATNSDGDAARRAFLLEQLAPGATERVVDPGRQVVEDRLSDPITGELSPECDSAVDRWYGRL